MIKKILKIIILLIVLGAISFGIYKNPSLILEEKTQEQLLDIADKLDNELNFNTGSLTWSWN